ncbi:MAG: GNAT family N-acetyltransferase [Candidatus Lokiarchaeota archaeon]|nr:GNAT family N-acetyltransferase [Candidatus Lokiarchaeota archaeon]
MGRNGEKEKSSLKKMQIMRWFSIPSYSIEDKKEENASNHLKHNKENKEKPKEKEDVLDISQFGEVKEGYPYIQMKLDGDQITKEFEEQLQTKIAQHIDIREATSEDISLLVDLYNRAFLTANDPYTPMTQKNMKAIYDYNETIILIAKIWGVNAGFIIIDFEGDSKEIGVIAGLGILPEWQKRGIGTTLGIASWDYFKKKGIKELKCEVYSKNYASYRLIKGIGFEPVGVKYYDFKH